MKIHQLTLYARSLDDQFRFYVEQLGFQGRIEGETLQIDAGSTQLIFKERQDAAYYHFAFLIPEGKLQQAITFSKGKGITLLLHEGRETIDFGTGTAIYFFDPSGNIVEFIDRPSLRISSPNQFNASEVICINEIGIPVHNPLQKVAELIDEFGIVPMDRSRFSEDFCWGGDFRGTFLVVQIGRNWLPTQLPAQANDFSIEFETSRGIQQAVFTYE